MADTAVQDQTLNPNPTSPAERKNNVPQWGDAAWERKLYETEPLAEEQSKAVTEAERILFPSTGSMNFTEIQVEDKPISKQEIQDSNLVNYDLFFKPLENVTNIAGTIINEAPVAVEALADLGKQITGVTEKQQEITPEKQKEAQINQWKEYRAGKIEETDRRVGQVEMEMKMKEALRITGGPVAEDAASVLGMNSSLSQENIMTRDKLLALATKRSENIKMADKAEEQQDAAEVKPANLVNRLDAQEGQSAVSSSGAIFGAG